MKIKNKNVLVTGAAGFIGFHLSRRLLDDGNIVIGIDNINDYYDINLKLARLAILQKYNNFTFYKKDIADLHEMEILFSNYRKTAFDVVINLAAQAGVRYSLKNPHSYISSNIVGFTNILECCRHNKIKHLVFASSSSIYGMNDKIPFSVSDNVDHPVSLYAASKKANELMAHTYAHLYGLPCTGLRFFTVYGPWGRPDMAYFSFTKAIIEGKPIDVFNYGKMKRDFTYIDDIIEGVVRVMDKIPQPNSDWDRKNPDPGSSYAPYKLYNIGNNNPVELIRFIEILEDNLGKKAQKNMMPMQPGDVPITYANVDDLMKDVGFKPSTPLEEGLKKFVEWYKEYYKQ
ncbi:MAG: NAD-dependent epimerase [Smithella sp.]